MKQKQQIIVLVVLVVVAALIWSFEWRRQAPSVQTASFIQDYKVLAVENPHIRVEKLKRAQETEYKSNGRNPFSYSVTPTLEQQRIADANKPKDLPLPPPPPPNRVSLVELESFPCLGMVEGNAKTIKA